MSRVIETKGSLVRVATMDAAPGDPPHTALSPAARAFIDDARLDSSPRRSTLSPVSRSAGAKPHGAAMKSSSACISDSCGSAFARASRPSINWSGSRRRRRAETVAAGSGVRPGGAAALDRLRPSAPDASGADGLRQDADRRAHHSARASTRAIASSSPCPRCR